MRYRPALAVWLIAAGVVVLVGGLYLAAPRFLATIELKLYDQHFALRGTRPAGDRVVIVAIDERSLRAVGRWPWPRSILADLTRKLASAAPAAIAFDILFSEEEQPGELRAVRRLAERLRRVGAGGPALERELAREAALADHDGRFAEAIRAAGRVVLAMDFSLGHTVPATPPLPTGPPGPSPLVAFRNYAARAVYPPPVADGVTLPIPGLRAAAAAVGHVNMLPDQDGTSRWEALVFERRGYYYPSIAVEAVRVAAGLDPQALKLDFGEGLEVGPVLVPTDARARVLIDYAGPARSFRYVSAADVLAGAVPADRLRDRLVFVGATAEGTYDLRVTPLSPILPGVEKHANVAENILDGRFLVRPDWVEPVELGGIVFWPLALALLLPRLRPVASLAATAAGWALLFGGTHLAFLRGLWLPLVYPTLAMALTFVAVTVFRFLTEERQRLWTKRAFQQYVSPEVVERMVSSPEALRFGGELRTVTVLFTDLRDFTAFAERSDVHEVVATLREYLTAMTTCVLHEGGTLDKYIGDAVMAIFGAPVAFPDHAARACRAALAMLDQLDRLNARWAAEGREQLRMGVGVNTGEMVVGNLGSEQLFDYTVVGDGVNLAARLESLNKEYRPARPVILSEETVRAAGGAIEARRLGEVAVKGKTKPVVIYGLEGRSSSASQAPSSTDASGGGAADPKRARS